MLRMMASENAEEFKHSPLVTQETIGAVIEAYGAGEIDLEAVEPQTKAGAIYDIPLGISSRTYTCLSVARFLGWTKAGGTQATNSCRIAFDAWHATHRYGVDVGRLIAQIPADSQTTKATEQVLSSIRIATREAQKAGLSPEAVSRAAKDAGREMVAEFKGETSARDIEAAGRARKIGNEAADQAKVKAGLKVDHRALKPLPTFVLDFADTLRGRVDALLADVGQKLEEVIPYRDQLGEAALRGITKTLRTKGDEVQRRFHRLATDLEARRVRNITPQERKRLHA
jgi:hypothetical protein